MKKTLLVLLLLVILPCRAHAFDLGSILGIGGDNGNTEEGQEQKKGKSKFLIHFTTGGTLETDNYSIGQDSIVVMTESGALYFDKKMVKSIEEVVGVEEEPVQNITIEPSATQTKPPARKPAEKPAKPATNGRRTAPSVPAPEATEPTDDDGHTEAWWKDRAKKWQEKKADAEGRYKEAEGDWAKYNGLLTGVDPSSISQYDLIRFQDLRGAARVEMDRAKADLDEANRMIDEVLPEEARKAGAPPGWLR